MLPSFSFPSLHTMQGKCRAEKPLGRRLDRPNILHRSVNVLNDSETVLTPTSPTGPNGQLYPHREVAALAAREGRAKEGRRGRSLFSNLPSTLDPSVTQQRLLQAYGEAREGGLLSRTRREGDTTGCVVGGAPPRLCKYASVCPAISEHSYQSRITFLLSQVNLQHNGAHVWSEPRLWPTRHHCPKVPRLAPASHL